jgi:hypothetical protein
MGLSLEGAAFSLSEPKSGEGMSRQGGGVVGSPEKSGSKRVRRLSLGRFISVSGERNVRVFDGWTPTVNANTLVFDIT